MASKNESKQPNFFQKVGKFFANCGRKIKETFSELKRVTWPTFPKVVKSTCVVIMVVVVFTLIVTGLNQGMQFLLNLITGIGA